MRGTPERSLDMMRYVASPDLPSQQFISMAVHDLRTPVTAIKGFGQLALRRRDLPPDLREHLETIVAEANRAAGYLEDLAIVSQIESGEPIVQTRPEDVAAILASAAERMNRGALAGSIVVERTAPVVTFCDETLTARALTHLIRIALKHAGHEPVRVNAASPSTARGATLAVSARVEAAADLDAFLATPRSDGESHDGENGAGAILRIPRPTFAGSGDVDFATRGLGLHIASKLIEAQGGGLWIDLPASGGARFLVVFSESDDRPRSSP